MADVVIGAASLELIDVVRGGPAIEFAEKIVQGYDVLKRNTRAVSQSERQVAQPRRIRFVAAAQIGYSGYVFRRCEPHCGHIQAIGGGS